MTKIKIYSSLKFNRCLFFFILKQSSCQMMKLTLHNLYQLIFISFFFIFFNFLLFLPQVSRSLNLSFVMLSFFWTVSSHDFFTRHVTIRNISLTTFSNNLSAHFWQFISFLLSKDCWSENDILMLTGLWFIKTRHIQKSFEECV